MPVFHHLCENSVEFVTACTQKLAYLRGHISPSPSPSPFERGCTSLDACVAWVQILTQLLFHRSLKRIYDMHILRPRFIRPLLYACFMYFFFFFFRIFAIRVNSQPLQIDISVGWICIFFNTFPFLLEGMSTILDREFLNIFASFFFLMFIVWSMEYIDYRVRVQINIKKMRFLQSKKYVINVSNVMIN